MTEVKTAKTDVKTIKAPASKAPKAKRKVAAKVKVAAKPAAKKTRVKKARAKKVVFETPKVENNSKLNKVSTLTVKNIRTISNKGIDFSQDNVNRVFDGIRNIINAKGLASLGRAQVKLLVESIESDMDHARDVAKIANEGRKEIQDLTSDLLPKWGRKDAA